MGGRGVFTQTNIEDRKEYSLKEWHQICHQNQNRPPQISSNSSSKTNGNTNYKNNYVIFYKLITHIPF